MRPCCPDVFAELALPQDLDEQILAILRAVPDDDLYAALAAVGLCAGHAARFVMAAVTDRTAGFKIRGFHPKSVTFSN